MNLVEQVYNSAVVDFRQCVPQPELAKPLLVLLGVK